MKVTLIITIIVITAAAVFATVAFAQGINTTAQEALLGTGMGMGGGRGPYGLTDTNDPLHTYMIAALANSVNLTSVDLESQLSSGKSLYDIAVAQGLAVDKIRTLISDARSTALDAAVKDGVITQVQADWMKAHMQGGSMSFGSGGLLYKYEVDALASAFKLTTAEVEARLATGQSAYDIAIALGTATDQISTVLTNARNVAIDAALKDGVITQTQAEAMKNNAHGFGFGLMDNGIFDGGMHGRGMGHGPRGGQTVQP